MVGWWPRPGFPAGRVGGGPRRQRAPGGWRRTSSSVRWKLRFGLLPRRGRRVRLAFSMVISASPCVFSKGPVGRGGPVVMPQGSELERVAPPGLTGDHRVQTASARLRPSDRGPTRPDWMQTSSGSRRVAFVAITAGMDARKKKKCSSPAWGRVGVSTASPGGWLPGWMRERTAGSWVTVMFSDGMGRQRPTGTAQGSIWVWVRCPCRC